jgi:LacI family transcriptional regulator
VGGAVAAVTHLVEAGHTRIGFLNNDDDVPATHLRFAGYRQVLQDHGIPFDDSLVVASASETLPGYELARRLLDRSDRPTALFCYNDRMAMGAYRAATELGLQIPRDLSIVGFDNQELIAANLFPGLTTVALPHYEMGVWAVETLVHLLNGEAEYRLLADKPTLLDCPLVIRGSVAEPRVN